MPRKKIAHHKNIPSTVEKLQYNKIWNTKRNKVVLDMWHSDSICETIWFAFSNLDGSPLYTVDHKILARPKEQVNRESATLKAWKPLMFWLSTNAITLSSKIGQYGPQT